MSKWRILVVDSERKMITHLFSDGAFVNIEKGDVIKDIDGTKYEVDGISVNGFEYITYLTVSKIP